MWCYTLLPKILNMSLTAGIVIALVLLARLPLSQSAEGLFLCAVGCGIIPACLPFVLFIRILAARSF